MFYKLSKEHSDVLKQEIISLLEKRFDNPIAFTMVFFSYISKKRKKKNTKCV